MTSYLIIHADTIRPIIASVCDFVSAALICYVLINLNKRVCKLENK